MDLSVIIPVYNGETYLDECLASMTRQGFREGVHEVIIVDDGSTDSTAEIALKYCHSFPYFRLIQTANQGVSAARNTGILESKGDYITFMDADDFFADDSYLSLEQIMRKNGLDLVAFKFAENTDELQIIKRNEQYRFYERLSPTSACSAIFKKSILEKHNILFVKEQQLLEDYTFCFKYHYVIQNGCGFFNRRPYYYRNNPDSVSKGIKSQKDPEVRLKKRKNAYNGAFIAISEIQKFAEENGFEEDTSYHGAISACMQTYLWMSMYSKEPPRKTIEKLNSIGFSLKSLKIKNIEGPTKKERIKSELMYLMRYRFFFELFSLVFRIIK